MPADLDAAVLKDAERMEPALAGPVRVLSVRRDRSGRAVYAVSARRLIPVDEEDPALRGISIALPAGGEVEVDAKGGVSRVSLASAGPAEVREARAFTRNLIDNGEVHGLAPRAGRARRGPAARQTHEVRTDPAGRKVIQRAGFDLSGRTR